MRIVSSIHGSGSILGSSSSSILNHRVQLSQAHSGSSGVSSIVWDPQGQCLITAGPDARILIHRLGSSSSPPPPAVLQHHRDAVTALALSPSGKHLSSGSADHSVKLYTYPDAEFQSNVTRFTLPIRSLAFSTTGGLLAAAGEDDGIKLISTIDSSIVRVLKGHNAPVISLAFDPKNEYLASAGSDGTVIYWALSSGKRLRTLYHAAPNADLNEFSRNQIAWHPKGDILAVPGRKNDVVMYDRDTGEKVYSLNGGHGATVGFLSWSPNGKYLATSAGDNQVMLWDVEKRQDLDRQKFDLQICSLAWKPKGNAVAVIDSDGKFGVWEPAVPSHMPSPIDLSCSSALLDQEGLLNFSDDDTPAKDESSKEGSPSPDEDNDQDYDSYACKKSSSSRSAEDQVPTRSKTLKSGKESEGVRPKESSSMKDYPKMQDSFQPGSTQQASGKRRFLCYNLLGSISSCENDGLSHIEVEFHDTGRAVRVPAMTDYFGFTMAAMNEHGSIFAAPQNGEKSPSTILYRPFSSWANNSEWSMRLAPEEEVRAVALGRGWVAASTSLHFLRIFSEGGLQRFLLSFAGPVVTMAGHDQLLAVVTHASSPLPCGNQVMDFLVLNVLAQNQVMAGHLPLSPGAHLTWLGFTESGLLSSYDSQGVLRVFSPEYSGCWIPIFSASKEQKSENETFWMVGLNSTQIFCVVCKLPERQPQVLPKPILSVLNLSLPLAYSDLGADELENEYIQGSWLLAQSRGRADEAACEGQEENHEEENILKMEAELDRCLLRLMAAACKGDKLVRAVELAKLLSLNKSLKGAIRLVSAMRLPALAERLNTILEEKLLQENSDNTAVEIEERSKSGTCASNISLNPNHTFQRILSSEASFPKVSPVPLATSVPKNSYGEALLHKSTIPDTRLVETVTDCQKAEGVPAASSKDDIDLDGKVSSTCPPNNNAVHRPSNPFAKTSASSTNQDGQSGVSILQSLKKMQGPDVDRKRKDDPSKPNALHTRPAKLAKTTS